MTDYPVGVTLRTFTYTPEVEVGQTVSARVIVSEPVSRDGWFLPTVGEKVDFPTGTISFTEAVTDQSGWKNAAGQLIDVTAVPDSYTHMYVLVVTVKDPARVVSQDAIGPFVLPTGDGSPIDLDTMLPAPTVAGGVVSVPDSWSVQVAAAEAAAAATVTTGAVVGDDLILTRTDATEINAGNVRGAPSTVPGPPGRAIELQTTSTHVQWRYVGDATWTDLVSLASITGDDGLSAELQTSATHIQWRQAGGSWLDLIPLASLAGPKGDTPVAEWDGTSLGFDGGEKVDLRGESSSTFLAMYGTGGYGITFSGIADYHGYYRALRIVWTCNGFHNDGKTFALTFNDDTAANYATIGSAGVTAIPIPGPQVGGQVAWIEIYGYDGWGNTKVVYGQSAGNTNPGDNFFATSLIGGTWGRDDPVTSVSLTPSHPLGATFYLYGVN